MNLRLDRRRFLVLSVTAGAGLTLGFATRRRHAPRHPSPWLTIRPDDTALLAVPFTPTYAEYIFLKGRRVLADQMEYLLAHFPRHSPLHERIQRWRM